MIGRFLCWIGLHRWLIGPFYWERECKWCQKRQTRDAIGFGDTLEFRWVDHDWTKDPLF